MFSKSTLTPAKRLIEQNIWWEVPAWWHKSHMRPHTLFFCIRTRLNRTVTSDPWVLVTGLSGFTTSVLITEAMSSECHILHGPDVSFKPNLQMLPHLKKGFLIFFTSVVCYQLIRTQSRREADVGLSLLRLITSSPWLATQLGHAWTQPRWTFWHM